MQRDMEALRRERFAHQTMFDTQMSRRPCHAHGSVHVREDGQEYPIRRPFRGTKSRKRELLWHADKASMDLALQRRIGVVVACVHQGKILSDFRRKTREPEPIANYSRVS